MKAAQVGATEAGNNWIGYVIHHAPGPMLAVQPTVELAKRFSRQRIDPLIAESPALRERVKPPALARRRQHGAVEGVSGGLLVITGANSAVGLRSMPARYLFLDEVDAYPPSADEEGDPVALAEARTRTFSWRRKVFLASTPTIQGISRIEREYEASDQRRFFVPCPHCEHMQWLRFERLRWDKGKPETAHYVCEACDGRIEEHHKTAMLQAGEWRATAEGADPGTIGFHLSASIRRSAGSPGPTSPGVGGGAGHRRGQAQLQEQRAGRDLGRDRRGAGLAAALRAARGLADRHRAGGRTVPDRRRRRAEGPHRGRVWAWGRGLESWLVDHIVVEGGPEHAETWDELRPTARARPGRMLTARGSVSPSSPSTPATKRPPSTPGRAGPVTRRSRRSRASRASTARRRSSGPTHVDVTEGGKKLRRGARLWTIAVATFKSETYRFLRLSAPTDEEIAAGAKFPAGYVHLPRGVDAEWVKQLVAEQLVTVKTKRGFSRLEWQKLRERNEALDCRVYARAAAWIAGADRWTEREVARPGGSRSAPRQPSDEPTDRRRSPPPSRRRRRDPDGWPRRPDAAGACSVRAT